MDLIEFRELKSFTKFITENISDEEYLNFQCYLAKNPLKGDLIQKTGGARKIRIGLPNKGKRGGARVIYYWHNTQGIIWFLKAYAKNDKADISENDRKEISTVIEDLKRGEL